VRLTRIKDLSKDAFLYGFGSVATKSVGFLLIPVYTRYLSPTDYGVLALISMYGSFLAVLIGMGQHSAVFRFYFKYDEDDPRRPRVMRTFLAMALAAAVPCGLLVLASRPLSEALLDDAALAGLLAMGIGINFLDLVEKVPLVLIRARRLALRYSVYTLVRTTTTIGFVLLFVVALRWNARGVLAGQLLSGALFTAGLYAWTMRGFSPRFDPGIGRSMLGFGLPLVPGLLLYFVFQNASRWFLQRFHGMDEVGLYALGTQFGQVLLLMNTAIQTAWPTFLYGSEKDAEARGLYARALTYYVAAAGFVAAVVVTFVPEIYRIMVDERFHASMIVVPWALVAVILLGVHQFGGVGINLKEKTGWYVVVTSGSALTAIGGNLALVPRYGILGAAAASAAAYVAQAAASLVLSQRLFPVRYEVRRIATLVAVFSLAALLGRTLPWPGLAAALAGKLALLAVGVPAMLWVLRFHTPDEWARVLRLVRRKPATA
jgi:O-antigen/teichoic acid export membrane protein